MTCASLVIVLGLRGLWRFIIFLQDIASHLGVHSIINIGVLFRVVFCYIRISCTFILYTHYVLVFLFPFSFHVAIPLGDTIACQWAGGLYLLCFLYQNYVVFGVWNYLLGIWVWEGYSKLGRHGRFFSLLKLVVNTIETGVGV